MKRLVVACVLAGVCGGSAAAGPRVSRGPAAAPSVLAPAPSLSLAPAGGFSFSLSAPLSELSLNSSLATPDPAVLPTAPALQTAHAAPRADASAAAAAARPRNLPAVPRSFERAGSAAKSATAGEVAARGDETPRGETLRERLSGTTLKTAGQFSAFFDGAANAADAEGGWVPGFLSRWWGGRREKAAARADARRALDTAPLGARVAANAGGNRISGRLSRVDDATVTILGDDGSETTVKRKRLSEVSVSEEAGELPGISDAARRRFEARRGYYAFKETDLWKPISAGVRAEIEALRALPDAAARKARLREIGQSIVEGIKARRGVREIGFHYNLHGGSADGYVKGGGIRAGRGDIALQYSTQGDMAYKVYLFRSSQVNLYDILDTTNPNLVSPRMGHVLNVFDSDSEYLRDAFAKGGALKPTAISIDFEEAWLHRRGMIGIPYSTYLAPPLEPFGRSGARVGLKGRLSKDEETLAAMRYIEAAVLGGAPAR